MENQKQGNGLKIATWVFIVLTVVTPLFGIGSIVCSINYKKYDAEKGSCKSPPGYVFVVKNIVP
ncbi:hypothetical protein [Staphylococcus aureus]|uniref:hypothetical protein n=1 Tax=Staphylococcus aureus TaxID=1280 RepID=UPI00044B1785|nr:hypothetical protein [Staphylococcus aureus]EUH15398.1 hypothetical protein O791_02287 [Staphylococcus aureus M0059]